MSGGLVLTLGFGLLILAASLYLAGMWFPASVCCAVGGIWFGSILKKMEEEEEK